jgi:hypothetical protein
VRPVGSFVSLYYDSVVIAEEGDVVMTPTGRSYRVIENRVQVGGKHDGRQHIRALVINHADVVETDRVLMLRWYRR